MNPDPEPIPLSFEKSAVGRRFDLELLTPVRSRVALVVEELRRDYPALKPYLVLTRKGQFVKADEPLEKMLSEAPELFVDDAAKVEILAVLRGKMSKEQQEQKIRDLAGGLSLWPELLFEIRFGHLDYAEIERMQMDPRVDAGRTPRSRASIRIVLGSLAEFAFGDGN